MTISDPLQLGFRGLLALLLAGFAALANAQTLKIATVAPDGSAWMNQMRAAAEQSKSLTDGRVQFKFYPGGVMGNDSAVLRKVRLGQLQGGALTGSEASAIFSSAQIYSLPFLFRDHADVDRVRSTMDPMVVQGFADKGFQVLSISGVGFAKLMSQSDIATREALRQRKVWVPQNDVIAERTFRGGGIAPISLPLPDVFTALQTGLIDTVGNTPAGAVALQWHGKLRSVLQLPLTYVTGFIVVDNRSWEKLSAEDQKAVLGAFAEASRRIDLGNRESDEQALEALQGMGVALVTPEPGEKQAWETVGREVVDALVAEGRLDAALVQQLREILAAARAAAAP